MISQASSQHSVTFIVRDRGQHRLSTLQAEFEIELRGHGARDWPYRDLAIIAVVGGGMRGTPGVAGRVFGTMGEENINIIAIAQGSSELNISFVIGAADVNRAVVALHRAFVLGG